MKKTKYGLRKTSSFKKDYKRMMKRGRDMRLIDEVIGMLVMGETLPEKYCDHALVGNWTRHRECHIQPDWILIYILKKDTLILELSRTGTHSDIFDE